MKLRTSTEALSIPLDEVIPRLETEIARLLQESQDRVVTVSFPETAL